ncbi:MAG TPA: hypothetical protein VMK65_13080 [Longimicrobiales bacterium]|nr:hypothetical protein [Longimicrobiales bacterium]
MRSTMTTGALLGALLLGLPATAAAQRGDGPRMQARVLESNPIERLLETRERLALTEEQVTRLSAIAARVDQETEAEVAQLRELRAKMPARGQGQPTMEERQRFRSMMEAARPAMERVREKHGAALDEARELLTAEQQATMRELMREQRQRPERRRPPEGRRRGGF